MNAIDIVRDEIVARIVDQFMPAQGVAKAHILNVLDDKGFVFYWELAGGQIRREAEELFGPYADYGDIDILIDKCWALIPSVLAGMLGGEAHVYFSDEGDILIQDASPRAIADEIQIRMPQVPAEEFRAMWAGTLSPATLVSVSVESMEYYFGGDAADDILTGIGAALRQIAGPEFDILTWVSDSGRAKYAIAPAGMNSTKDNCY